MTTARELLQEARELIEHEVGVHKLIDRIDAFLAQPEPEPVGVVRVINSEYGKATVADLHDEMLPEGTKLYAAQPEPEPVAWMFRYRGRFGKTDWTEWQPIAGSERPVIEHAECEAYPLFKVATG